MIVPASEPSRIRLELMGDLLFIEFTGPLWPKEVSARLFLINDPASWLSSVLHGALELKEEERRAVGHMLDLLGRIPEGS